MKIILTGYIDVPGGLLRVVKPALQDHIRLSRAETGCISFSVTPVDDCKGRFEVREVFIDRAAFDFHQRRTAASHWAEITKDITRNYTVTEIDR